MTEETKCTGPLGEGVEPKGPCQSPYSSFLHTNHGAHTHPPNPAEVSGTTMERKTILKQQVTMSREGTFMTG